MYCLLLALCSASVQTASHLGCQIHCHTLLAVVCKSSWCFAICQMTVLISKSIVFNFSSKVGDNYAKSFPNIQNMTFGGFALFLMEMYFHRWLQSLWYRSTKMPLSKVLTSINHKYLPRRLVCLQWCCWHLLIAHLLPFSTFWHDFSLWGCPNGLDRRLQT